MPAACERLLFRDTRCHAVSHLLATLSHPPAVAAALPSLGPLFRFRGLESCPQLSFLRVQVLSRRAD